MPTRLPISSASEVARQLFASHVSDGAGPSLGEFLEAIRQFERVQFDVPDMPDVDGFLFQFGPASWLPDPTFTLGVARQLEVVDEEGEHEKYVQILMDYHFALDAELETLGGSSSWWFRGSDDDLSAWLSTVESHPVWQVVSRKRLQQFVIAEDEA